MRGAVSKAVVLLALLVAFAFPSAAAEVKVMISGGFSAAYKQLVPEFEKSTGNNVETAYGPSMGKTPQAIPNRMERGEPVDVVIMVGSALEGLIKKGKVKADSRVDLVESFIGAAVREGAPKPDISTVDAFKKTLIEAKSIAYSDSASGVYLSTVLFPRLGIYDQIKDKSRMIPAEPVGQVVARGEAELGFQQISELMPVHGITIVGPLPPELQKITIFGAGVAASSKEPEAGKALIHFLSSSKAADVIRATGLRPIPHGD